MVLPAIGGCGITYHRWLLLAGEVTLPGTILLVGKVEVGSNLVTLGVILSLAFKP